ncbi:MAG: hypothetical protein HY669_02585 [Chloroflexi bacterium]|nr:hypothetical protein [Chloroflexota bacterium]
MSTKPILTPEEEAEADRKRGMLLLGVYVTSILLLVGLYLLLHWLLVTGQARGPDSRDKSLAAITSAELLLSAPVVDTKKLGQQVTDTVTVGVTKAQADQITAAFKAANQEAVKAQKEQVKTQLATLATEVPKTTGIDQARAMRSLESLKKENDKDEPSLDVERVYLDDLQNTIVEGVPPQRGFWSSGWLKWLELFFWALLGTFLYTLWEIQRWLTKEPVGKFRNETPWYVSTTVRGPIVALFLLFAFSAIKLDVVNANIDFDKANILVWIFLAGVLGLFSRVAYDQLSLIVKTIFGKAWALALDQPSVMPPTAEVAFGDSRPFSTEPKRDVKWDIWPEGLGDMDPASGKYTAPTAVDAQKGAVTGATVTVRATMKDEPSKVETASVTLYEKFVVKSDDGKDRVAFGSEHTYTVDPPQKDGGVTWTIEPVTKPPLNITPDGKFIAPKEGNPPEAKDGAEFIIKATRVQKPKVSSSMKVTLFKGP